MRNLKRALSLTLALVMALGLLMITSSAASVEFPDADEITYTEAVQVMNGLGILVGDENGNFNPTDTLTREQAAKIISYMLIGTEFADQLAGMGTGSFTDVAADRWSAGYIDYCANLGIIAGNGDGTFDPAGQLTGVAFAKMLLVALGNDPEENGYVGEKWAISVGVDAAKTGLTISGVSLSAPLAREQAAQMAFTALNYTADGGSVEYVVTKNGTVLYKGTNEDTAALIAGLNGGATITENASNAGSLGNTVFGLTKITEIDDFGRESVTYTNGETGNDEVIFAALDADPDLSYTTGVTYGKIVSDLGYTKSSDKVTLNVITDGDTANAQKVTAYKSNTDTTLYTVGGRGTLTEVYATDTDDEYNVFVIHTFVTKLAKSDIIAASTTNDPYITIAGATYDTDAFVKDDVVLYTAVITPDDQGNLVVDKIVNVVKADYESGYVTATASDYIRVDGVQKYLSDKTNVTTADSVLGISDSTVKTFYYDTYGNVIFAVEGETAEAATHYTYVVAIATKAAKSNNDNLFDTSDSGAAVAQAKVIDLATGEIKVVNLGVVQGTDGKYYYATKTGAADTNKGEISVDATIDVGAVYSYAELDNGSWALISAPATVSDITVATSNANIGGVSGKFANSSTVLTVVNCTRSNGSITGASVTTYTGIANFPASGKYASAVVVDSSNIISNIIVVQDESTTLPYAVYDEQGETDSTGTLHKFYVDGETVAYYLADATGLTEGDVVQVSVSDNTATVTPATAGPNGTVTYVDDAYVILDNGSVYYFASSYQAVDADASYALTSVDEDDVVTLYLNADSEIEFVVVDN